MRHECEASVTVAAVPEAVWAVVSDVTRVGEWSGECRGCEWVGDARGPAVGARFRGRNRRGGFRWTRLNEVVTADAPHTLVWRTLARTPYFDSTEWRITLADDGAGGTRVTESFQLLKMSRLFERLLWVVMPAHRDRSGDLAADLGRLKVVVESAARPAPGGPG
ncbi:MAG TPA: SRPBCC family protein [Acidimicrobiia bacterium]|nr:SRPBCC family protein [Acidimicrobiia bacterium]